MKGSGVKGDVLASSLGQQAVNSGHRSAAIEQGQTCQERVDTKAFTGKGTRRDLRQLQTEIASLEQHMAELSALSKQVAGAQMYLMLHQRHSTGYVFLRWREMGGDKRHLSWEEARDVYMPYEQRTRAWYVQITSRAVAANAAHVEIRKDIRAVRGALKAWEGEVYARPVPG